MILAAIVLAFLAFDGLLARRSLDRHDGDARAAQDDGGDDLPAAEPLIPDGRPLGDTAQAHDETSPPRPGEGLARATRGRGAGGAARRNDAWSGAVLEEERPEDA